MDPRQKEMILKKFEKQIVFFPGYQHAWSQMEKAVEASTLRQAPSSAFIMGKTGVGKSTLCKLFMESFGPRHDIETQTGLQKIVPALYIVPTTTITIKGLCHDILHEFMERIPNHSVSELTHMIVKKLKECQVKAVIFDEIQRLMRPDAEKTRQVTLDWMVALLTLTGLPIILCGDETCEDLLEEEATRNSPFARRYCYTSTLEYFSYSDQPENEYHLTLSELDKAIYSIESFQGNVHLQDPNIKLPLFVASSGILEYIRQILYEALYICLSAEHPILTTAHFVDAYPTLRLPVSLSKKNNPFSLSTSECYQIIEKHGRLADV
ncbi:ATP-binding protein [Pseudomonas plecoglossicida]|uniref:ATP-binding protein n=1 Tax=Pseudomonas plecoglossicida TaxID=70775 RepID=A0A2R7UAJ0_PSEDL|nr:MULTISPECIES: ATP-binding protein [Pseudomonas]MDM9556411.1 ATP-binding protein [Pseudomonas asiatica]PTU49208.1 ATP-binding protein [Pseudomonas plecoglossicida]